MTRVKHIPLFLITLLTLSCEKSSPAQNEASAETTASNITPVLTTAPFASTHASKGAALGVAGTLERTELPLSSEEHPVKKTGNWDWDNYSGPVISYHHEFEPHPKSKKAWYKNGKKDGPFMTWDGNGNITSQGQYQNDFRDGLWTVRIGEDHETREYEMGVPVGIWISWDEYGNKVGEIEYHRNDGWVFGETRWYSNGQKKYLTGYTIPPGEKIETHWYENGQPKEVRRYGDTGAEGLWTDWYENGEKAREGEYRSAEPVGIWTEWYSNGQKKSEGKLVWQRRDNAPAASERAGIWTYWYRNGAVNTAESGDYGDNGYRQ